MPNAPKTPAPTNGRMLSAHEVAIQIRREALHAGFESVGITSLSDIDPKLRDRLTEFLDEGRHGDMQWMLTHRDRRSSPQRLWPEARSAVMLGQSYAPSEDPLRILGEKQRAAISVYARGKDYHDILKNRLKHVARKLATLSGADVKVFVDTAPLMEKPLAAKAGLGWQGKHTNLVSRQHGSWLFLGAILTTADLGADEPAADRCGSCTRCLDICPTAAFPAPYQLDARRCIAYLTIEHKGPIPREFRTAIGNRVFGCDDCLAVCPWNKFAEAARETRFSARVETDNPGIAAILNLDDASFRQHFAGTPIKRTGRDRVVRNALIAAGNSGDEALLPPVRALLDDPNPIVRGAAVWALARLMSSADFASERDARQAVETDAIVTAEWMTEAPA